APLIRRCAPPSPRGEKKGGGRFYSSSPRGEGDGARRVRVFLRVQRFGEIGQAHIHAVIDAGVIVGEFLVAMGDALAVQFLVNAAGAVEDGVLVLGAAIEEEALQAGDIAGMGL